MAEDPKRVFIRATEAACYTDAPKYLSERRMKTQRQREVQLVLESLHEHRVFYYPGAGQEWEPLRRLTHLCDTFIFCDWNVTQERVDGDFGLGGVATDFIIPLCKEDVTYLTDLGPLPHSIREGVRVLAGARVEPWGKYAVETHGRGRDSATPLLLPGDGRDCRLLQSVCSPRDCPASALHEVRRGPQRRGLWGLG